jgi:hypothetical protein
MDMKEKRKSFPLVSNQTLAIHPIISQFTESAIPAIPITDEN